MKFMWLDALGNHSASDSAVQPGLQLPGNGCWCVVFEGFVDVSVCAGWCSSAGGGARHRTRKIICPRLPAVSLVPGCDRTGNHGILLIVGSYLLREQQIQALDSCSSGICCWNMDECCHRTIDTSMCLILVIVEGFILSSAIKSQATLVLGHGDSHGSSICHAG